MKIIAGIDEAGYGPTLGPLVVTAVVFSVPDDHDNMCLWHLLGDVVTKRGPRALGGRIVVDDSKKVYSNGGLKRLEEGIMSFLWGLKKAPVTSFLEMLRALSHHDGNALNAYPWYEGKDFPLPISSDPSGIESSVQLLTRAMTEKGIMLHGIRSVPVYTLEFNRQVDMTDNKSLVLFQNCADLLATIWEEFGAQGPNVFIDKLGGRNGYHHLLSSAFRGRRVKTLNESRETSTYVIRGHDREMTVSFIKKADDKHFPAALASMCSKYVRELFLKLFNAYWQERVPGLRPTAGYPLDAQRFLQQIYEAKEACGIADNILIRKR